ncbi:hypothetical protein AB0H63_04020 [Micromonospora echinospora]|uniref:hypothetical protein n=1 Tax=Micromonospora echinospora TaxID=1877 RepID=UPI0033E66050
MGWPLANKVRIRLALPDDMPAVKALLTATGGDLDEEVVKAVSTGVVAAALRAGLKGGKNAFVEHLAQQLFDNQRGDQNVPLRDVTLVLVAEHDEQGVVGALVALPPVRVIDSLLDHMRSTGADGLRMTQLLYSAVMGMTRIKAIAVAEGSRGTGIGGALLLRCWQVYERNDYMIIFGQTDDSSGLPQFLQRHGFVVLDPDTGFDPWVVLGVHADVRPDTGLRTILWRRGQNRRVTEPPPRQRGTSGAPSDVAPPTPRRYEQALQDPRARSLPLLNAGTLPLVMAAAEKPYMAPLNLVAAAACQAGQRVTAEARARLHRQVAAALCQLGFRAWVLGAQVTAWRDDRPDNAMVRVGTDGRSRHVNSPAPGGHTIVWAESFGALLDIAVFFDSQIRGLASDGLHELIASPAVLPLGSLEPFAAAGVMPTIERGPIRVGWELTDVVEAPGAPAGDSDAVRRGGEVLADATIDLLVAADGYVDLAPMHARFPHLRAVMTRRAGSLWGSAGSQ